MKKTAEHDQSYRTQHKSNDLQYVQQDRTIRLDWTKILYNHNIPIDCQSFEKWDRNMQIDGQQTLEKDIPRTRSKQPQMQKQTFRDVLRRIATFYCKQNRLCYQQGLLQVIYPFALLRNRAFSTKKCYAYFNAFMRNYFPKVLTMKKVKNKKQLPHAVLALKLTSCLLRFHFPEIYGIFIKQEIHISMVATQQLMTIFAKTLHISFVFQIFDFFIKKEDPHYLLFMCVALIGRKQQQIKASCKNDTIHSLISNLKDFKCLGQLKQWFQYSNKIAQKTPSSFVKMIDRYGFSNRNILTSQDLQDMVESEKLFPKDYLYIQISQINKNSSNFVFIVVQNKLSGSSHSYQSITIKDIEKKGTLQLDRQKIYVLASRQDKKQEDIQKLLQATEQLKLFKIAILSTQLKQKPQKCRIF